MPGVIATGTHSRRHGELSPEVCAKYCVHSTRYYLAISKRASSHSHALLMDCSKLSLNELKEQNCFSGEGCEVDLIVLY